MARTVNPESYGRQRARILAATAEEFAARGYDGTSTASICRRAGISSGTLFHYFPGKQDLLRGLFADDLPRLHEIIRRATETPDADVGLDLLLDHLVSEVSDPLSPGLAATALLRAPQDPELATVLAALDAVVESGLTVLLRRVGAEHPDRLVFPIGSTARWVRGLVDAGHLDLVDGPRDRTVSELRQIIDWLLGRT